MEGTFNGATQPVRDSKVIKDSENSFDIHSLISNEINEKVQQSQQPPEFIVTLDDLIHDNGGEFPWLVQNLLPQSGQAVLAGSSDIGKTTWCRQFALAVVSGQTDFLGWPLKPTHFKAIIASTEDSSDATSSSIQKQLQCFKAFPQSNLRFIFEVDDLPPQLDEALTHEPADVVVVDCFADASEVDLKDTHKIRAYLSRMQKIVRKHKCLILFIHHTAKRTENLEPSKNNLLSGQGLEAKMRLVIELRADQFDSSIRHMCIVKANYLSDSMKKQSHVLAFEESTLTFSNTGARKDFSELAKLPEDPQKEKYLAAVLLKKRGFTHEQIATEIGYETKGAVSKLLATGEKKGWDKVSSPNTAGNLQNPIQ